MFFFGAKNIVGIGCSRVKSSCARCYYVLCSRMSDGDIDDDIDDDKMMVTNDE